MDGMEGMHDGASFRDWSIRDASGDERGDDRERDFARGADGERARWMDDVTRARWMDDVRT